MPPIQVEMNGRSPVLRFVNTRGSLNGFDFNGVQDAVLMQGCELNGTTRSFYTGISPSSAFRVANFCRQGPCLFLLLLARRSEA